MVTKGVHWVAFFPSVKLCNSHVDWKMSPEHTRQMGEQEMGEILILGESLKKYLHFTLMFGPLSGFWEWLR